MAIGTSPILLICLLVLGTYGPLLASSFKSGKCKTCESGECANSQAEVDCESFPGDYEGYACYTKYPTDPFTIKPDFNMPQEMRCVNASKAYLYLNGCRLEERVGGDKTFYSYGCYCDKNNMCDNRENGEKKYAEEEDRKKKEEEEEKEKAANSTSTGAGTADMSPLTRSTSWTTLFWLGIAFLFVFFSKVQLNSRTDPLKS